MKVKEIFCELELRNLPPNPIVYGWISGALFFSIMLVRV